MQNGSDPAAAAGLTAVVTEVSHRGSGDDVVLVHGALGDYRQWGPVGERLRDRFTAITLSRRFHWPNAARAPEGAYSHESHAADLVQYLRSRGRQVHLVGHSYGASVALLAAVREPAVLRSLVLIEPAMNTLLPVDAPGLDAELEDRNAMQARVNALVLAGRDEDASRELIDWTQGGPGGFAALPDWAQRGLLDNAITIGPTLARRRPTIGPDDLRQLEVPTAVLAGERTRLYYRLIADVVLASMRGACAASIPHARHMSLVERPAETADAVLAFLTRH